MKGLALILTLAAAMLVVTGWLAYERADEES
jgi:hypothetical protein